MTADEIAAVKRAVTVEGRTITNITRGVPIGGGAKDYSKAIINSSVLMGNISAILNLSTL
jgi:hypothetical protein